MTPSIIGGKRWSVLDPVFYVDFTESELAVNQSVAVTGGANTKRMNSAGVLVTASAAPRQDCYNLNGSHMNLLTFPDLLDNQQAWTLTSATMVQNPLDSGLGPLGLSYFKLTEAAATSVHSTQQSISHSGVSGDKFVLSIYVAAGERTKIDIQTGASGIGTLQKCTFDVGAKTATVSGTGASAGTITAVASAPGWYRCSFVVTASASFTSIVYTALVLNAAGSQSYLGDGTSGIYVAGAMADTGAVLRAYIEPSLVESYCPPRPSSWGAGTGTSFTTSTFADGSTCDKITGTLADSFTAYGVSPLWAASNLYSACVWLKADAPTTINIYMGDGVGTTQTTCSLTTQWKRFSVQRTLASAATGVNLQIGGGNSLGIGGVVYAYGAMLANSPMLGTTFSNGGAPSVPNFAPVPGTSISAAVTNLLLRSEDQTNASWTRALSTITADTTTAPDGTTTADAWVEDSTTGVRSNLQQITKAASSIIYTFSIFVKWRGRRVGIGFQNSASSAGVEVVFDPSLGRFVSTPTSFGAGFTTLNYGRQYAGKGWWRVWVTATSDTTTALKSQLVLYNGATSSYLGNGSSGVFLWGAQTVVGNAPGAYTPTVASTVTTTADSLIVSTATLASFGITPAMLANGGTLYWDGYYLGHNNTAGTFPSIIGVYDSADPQRNSVEVSVTQFAGDTSTYNIGSRIRNAGVGLGGSVGVAPVRGERIKIAVAWDATSCTVYLNGVSTRTDSSLTMPPLNTLAVCGALSFQSAPHAITREARLYVRKMTTAELQAITT